MVSFLDKAKSVFATTAASGAAAATVSPAQLLMRLKTEALAQASATAKSEQRQPTLSDYFIAAHHVGIANQAALQEHQIPWGPKIYADLSGLTVTGFLIREGEISPSADIRAKALELATSQAQQEGRKAKLPDFLNAVRLVNDSIEGGLSSEAPRRSAL